MTRGWSRGLGLAVLLAALGAQATEATSPQPAWKGLLQEQIARARRTQPQAFLRFTIAASRVDALDAKKQATLAATAPGLRALGPEALWPMVERLAFPAQDKASLPMRESARLALTVGMVEAAGALRDVRLAPLWQEMLEAQDTPPPVLHAAAGALARLETLSAANTLIALSRQEGPRGEAALDALGLCRRLVATRALADALEARPDRERMRHIARALGDAGSVWAWKTSGVKARAEEGAVRRVAAEALVRVYLKTDGDVRRAVSNALLRVDAPETPALIDAARARAEPPQQAELDALSERLRRNPLR
ncbi:hypothetical protein [Comamonas sp. JC664]|uniref:hypothetical protein n=1 Tax=Comamonas sp. JC664 TaxID=2801917 RepID=UPI00174C731F|nr:hypothetical protein [Comamonas sp. JC664]MBL0694691.1 hypothetical protein [Comamonas sp. JC664]GHG94051.1 hypothetical protein GCM10012319_56690 [Comamonas sp. KCTC 72670]